MRIGIGYDIHKLVTGGVLILGGVTIDADRGYSPGKDHDVLLHSLIDALAGALCLGDVSDFLPSATNGYPPDSDPLKSLGTLIESAGYKVANVDFNIITGACTLRPHAHTIRSSIADRLDIDIDQVSIKGRSNGGFREEGQGLAISSQAAVCVQAI